MAAVIYPGLGLLSGSFLTSVCGGRLEASYGSSNICNFITPDDDKENRKKNVQDLYAHSFYGKVNAAAYKISLGGSIAYAQRRESKHKLSDPRHRCLLCSL